MNTLSDSIAGMKGISSSELFCGEFLSGRFDRFSEKCVERVSRVGPHFLAALIARFYLSRSGHDSVYHGSLNALEIRPLRML
jgi:hypothetical protein